MKYAKPLSVIFLVLFIDQFLKFYVKLHYAYSENHQVFKWFYLYFIENEGMAFGWKWGGGAGKIILTSFRIIAACFIWYWMRIVVNRKSPTGLIVAIALIFAGAVGNIIDSVFYGLIFSDSPPGSMAAATLFPAGGGYAGLLHGKVVDMLYFPIFEGFLPKWIPEYGGDYFIFFRPVFNIADASITSGVILIILFQKTFFGQKGGTQSETIEFEQQVPPEQENEEKPLN